MPRGIRGRLFLLIVLTLIPVLVLQGWLYYQRYASRRDAAMQTELEVAQGIATTFTSHLNDVRRQLNTVGQAIIAFDPYTDAKAERLLTATADQYLTVRNVSWVSPQGVILASTLPDLVGIDVSHRPYFQEILAGQSWALGDLMPRGSVTTSPIFVIATPIDDGQGVRRGMVVAAMEPTNLGEQTFAMERPGGGAYTIFDRQGRLVYRGPEIPLTWEQRSRWRQSDPLLQEALGNRIAQGFITSLIDGRHRVAARVPIPGIDWAVGASRPAQTVMGPVRLALIREALLGLLVSLFAFAIAYLIARTIARPLRRLEQEAKALGQGRMGPTGEPDGPTEVRRLRMTITQMAADLIDRAEAVRRSEQRYRKLFEANLTGVYLTRLDGTIIDFNDAMMHMLGYDSREQVFQHRSLDFYADPESRKELLRLLQQDGVVPAREALLQRRDGSLLYALGYATVLTDEQTGEPYIQGVAVDITDRKRAEEELRQSEARLNRSEEIAHLGSWELDLITNELTWSDEVYRIFGLEPREFGATYEAFLERVHPDDRQAVDDAYNSSLREGRDTYEIDHRIVRKDSGEVRFVHEKCEHFRDGAGRIIRSLGMVHDITERKRAEEALRRQQELLETILNTVPAGVVLADVDGNFTYASPHVARMLGQPISGSASTVTPGTYEVLKPDHTPFGPDELPLAQAIRTGTSIRGAELVIRRADGSEVAVQADCAPVKDAQGQVTGAVVSMVDITSRKQAEQALRESEARHRRLIENLKGSHFVYVHDTNGVFTYVSESITGILGYTPDEFMASYDKYLTDHPVNQEVRRHTELSIQGIRQPPYQVNSWHKDGSTRWLEVQEVPIFDDEGRVIGIEGVAQDITERKRAEEALRESEQWFRTLTNAMPQLVWTADPDGRVDYYNDRYKEYRGIEPTEDGSFQWAPVLHEDDAAPTVIAWEHAIRTGQTYQVEHRVQRADGSYHWHLSRGTPLRDGEGRIVKWLGTATDIDNVKRTEEALRELTATLESRVAQRTAELEHRTRQLQKLTLELMHAEDRERKRLAEILHDDLQQQLAAAKFHLSLLGNRVRDDASLREEMNQVGELVKDAIAKSRSLSHELSPAMLYHGDFGEAIEWLASGFQTKHGLAVHVEVCGRVEVASEPVRAFLFRTAQEILFNVVKHAGVTEASVRLRRRNRQIRLTVSDRGRGFDSGTLGQAAGLGLLSIRERAELLGGRMKIRSAPGRGCTLLLVVPDRKEAEDAGQWTQEGERNVAGAGPRARPTPGDRKGSPLRVLLVDDHKIVREGLATLLNEQQDIEVVGQAANGREAVDLAYEMHPDVVVMDVAMPVMEGDEAARRIKRDLPRTRIVSLSMFDEPAMVERMREAGAEQYMLKTAPSQALLAAIRNE